MDQINWDLLANHFLQEPVDFEYELYGRGNYNRQSGVASREEMQDTATSRIDGLLAELDAISEDRGSDGLEDGVPTRGRGDCAASEETTTVAVSDGLRPAVSMHGMSFRGCDRRRERRHDRVHSVWPDPVTGCVYGGQCALLVRDDERPHACHHPPVQSNRTFHERRPFLARRLPSGPGKRNVVPFASRNRWRGGRGKGKYRSSQTGPRAKI